MVHHGRFQDVPLEGGSVDAIVTDPPYGGDQEGLYGEFSAWAAKVLKPGGSAFVMIGFVALDRTLAALCRALTYKWTLVYAMPKDAEGGFAGAVPLFVRAKPVLWLTNGSKPTLPYHNTSIFYDENLYKTTKESREKHLDAWQQGRDFFDWLIERFTLNTDVVADPFLGSGTTGVSAKGRGRHFIGIECDRATYEIATARIHGSPGPT